MEPRPNSAAVYELPPPPPIPQDLMIMTSVRTTTLPPADSLLPQPGPLPFFITQSTPPNEYRLFRSETFRLIEENEKLKKRNFELSELWKKV